MNVVKLTPTIYYTVILIIILLYKQRECQNDTARALYERQKDGLVRKNYKFEDLCSNLVAGSRKSI